MRITGTRTLASMTQSSSPLVMHPLQEDPLDGLLLQICEAFSEGLLSGDPNAKGTISDAANAWGYWHLGQFAADFRNMFGELPSKTLTSRGG